MKDDLIVTEDVEKCRFYHLSHRKNFTRSLCGKSTMITSLPLSEWGKAGNLNERYCQECTRIGKNGGII